jgi:hypothetical protein
MESNIRIIRLAFPITDFSEAKAMPEINLISTAILLRLGRQELTIS